MSRSMFAKYNSSTARITASSEGTTNQPLPTLLRLLHREPLTRVSFNIFDDFDTFSYRNWAFCLSMLEGLLLQILRLLGDLKQNIDLVF